MPFQQIIKVANASAYERSDYVEVDLEFLNVPSHLDENTLRLSRIWNEGNREEIPFQLDCPFGRDANHRVMTFFSKATPSGPDDYSRHTAEFLLEEGKPSDFSGFVRTDLLKIQHYSSPGEPDTTWDPSKAVIGVRLCNGGEKPEMGQEGLQVYISLVPSPELTSPANYAGAATSVRHHRAWRATKAGEFLQNPFALTAPVQEKRWGQLTRIEFCTLPWEQPWYQTEFLLGEPGRESEYSLAWSRTGPLRATVTLQSKPVSIRLAGKPFFNSEELVLSCHLYRTIFLYPHNEFYTEQVSLRTVPEDASCRTGGVSLAFRPHYYSFVDYPESIAPQLDWLERIPDYFAIWRSFATEHRGYAFASDSHVRGLDVNGSATRWRLELGHEHRCVHLFPYHSYPDVTNDRFRQIGQTWYEQLFKPLRAIPLRTRNLPDSTLNRDISELLLGTSMKGTKSTYEPSGFRPGTALTDRDKLPGRAAVINRLFDRIANRGSARLLGPRRAGKTSVLYALLHRLRSENYNVRYVALGGSRVQTESDIARLLDDDLPKQSAADALLQRLRERKRNVWLIDEVAYLETGEPGLFGWLRSAAQDSDKDTAIIYSGTHWDWARVIDAANAGRVGSAFGNETQIVELEPISRIDAMQFLLENTPSELRSVRTAEWIVELCGAWPFYLQVMGDAVVQAIRVDDRKALESLDGVTELYESRLLEDWDTVFRGRWNELPRGVQEILLCDSERGRPDYAELNYADRNILCQVGLCRSIHGWIEDRPFFDWINRHRSGLERGLEHDADIR